MKLKLKLLFLDFQVSNFSMILTLVSITIILNSINSLTRCLYWWGFVLEQKNLEYSTANRIIAKLRHFLQKRLFIFVYYFCLLNSLISMIIILMFYFWIKVAEVVKIFKTQNIISMFYFLNNDIPDELKITFYTYCLNSILWKKLLFNFPYSC